EFGFQVHSDRASGSCPLAGGHWQHLFLVFGTTVPNQSATLREGYPSFAGCSCRLPDGVSGFRHWNRKLHCRSSFWKENRVWDYPFGWHRDLYLFSNLVNPRVELLYCSSSHFTTCICLGFFYRSSKRVV